MKGLLFGITMGYLIIMAIWDGKKKEIPVLPGWLCLVILLIVQIVEQKGITTVFLGMGVGLFLWLISKLSKGGIGEGDALIYVITGVSLGFFRNLEVLILSLMTASFVSLWLLVIKRKGRKYRIPFIPFTMFSYGLLYAVESYTLPVLW